MVTIEQPEAPVLPDQLRRDNWQLYVLARSNDPTVMIPNTRKLVSNLVISAKILKDFSRNKDLIYCISTVNEAWYEYSENHDWGFAAAECEKVTDRIGDLLYDERWAIAQKDSFIGKGKK